MYFIILNHKSAFFSFYYADISSFWIILPYRRNIQFQNWAFEKKRYDEFEMHKLHRMQSHTKWKSSFPNKEIPQKQSSLSGARARADTEKEIEFVEYDSK